MVVEHFIKGWAQPKSRISRINKNEMETKCRASKCLLILNSVLDFWRQFLLHWLSASGKNNFLGFKRFQHWSQFTNLKPIFSLPTSVVYQNLLSKFHYKHKMKKPLIMINLQCFCDIIFTKETLIRVNYMLTT